MAAKPASHPLELTNFTHCFHRVGDLIRPLLLRFVNWRLINFIILLMGFILFINHKVSSLYIIAIIICLIILI